METGEATSYAPPARALRPVVAPSASLVDRPNIAVPEGSDCFDGQLWTFRQGFDRVLQRTPRGAWQEPEQQGWQRIKENARREVWRAHLAGTAYYLKYYARDGWSERLRTFWRGPSCGTEWQSGLYALRAGIAAVRPVGYTENLVRAGREYCLLVTEAVEPAYSLDEFWSQIQTDPDLRRRRRDAHQVVELLAEMIARAHQAGFQHLDMHAANILVQPKSPGCYETLFVDLQSARRGVPIRDDAVVRNLAQLNQWFRRHSSIGDRLRFLRSYLRWRDEYESAFEHSRPLGLSLDGLMRALVLAAERHAQQLAARRDRRSTRTGRYFARIRLNGSWRGLVVVQTKHQSPESRSSHIVTEPAWWRQQLRDPLRWFTPDAEPVCKDSHSASVRRAVLEHPDGNLPVFIKRPLARDRWRGLRQLWPPSRSMRAWRVGHGLLNRHVPAARPLAVLERRRGPFVLDSLLITEAIPGAVDLETFLRREAEQHPRPGWIHLKRELADRLAHHVRQLGERGVVHRDCKASNILVLAQPHPRLFWIDMDGLRPSQRRLREPAALRALARLQVSLLDVPGLTRTDRLRFLRSYCARWGSDRRAWRSLWRKLDPLVRRKIGAKQARRNWKLAHYGRE